MKGMLIKDLSLLKGQKQFFLAACMFAIIFLFGSNKYYFGISYLIIMFAMFTLSTISYDEYDNGSPFLFTLPISRKGYVREKYVFCLLISGIAWVIFTLLTMAMTVIKGQIAGFQPLILASAGALVLGILMISLMIPLQLKFGSEKRQIAAFVCFAGLFFLIYCGSKLVDKFGVPGFAGKLGNITMSGAVAASVIIVITAVLISYLAAVHIMERKEL